jgi:MFS family permease
MLSIPPNILKYYLLRLFSGLIFTYVIYAIFLLSRGITVAELATYASLTVIFSTVLDIPTGYVADRFGRKFSVALSYFIGGLTNLALTFVTNLDGLIVIAFLMGLSTAFASGALESLMYDEIQQHNPGLNFLKVTTTGTNIALLSASFASFVSPILYVANPIAPFVLTGVVNLGLSILVLFFDERRHSQHPSRNIKLIDGVKSVWQIAPIRCIVLIDLLLLIFVTLYYKVLFFPKIQRLGMPVEYLGVVDVFTLAITALLLHLAARITFRSEKLTLAVYTLAVALLFVFFGLSSSLAPALIFGMLFDPLWNTSRHVIPTITNRYFDAHQRALNLSSMSFISNLGAAVLVPIATVAFTQSYWYSVIPLAGILLLLFIYPGEHSPAVS